MQKLKSIPVIDLFAGPGGLGEGFSSLYIKNQRAFNIRLSIEKDKIAHETLELRSFYRQFPKDNIPAEYYELLRESNLQKRNKLREKLFQSYYFEGEEAKKEAWLAELGSPEYPKEIIDERISIALNKKKEWVLIGGPPCQAYSIVGRSRTGGVYEDDKRIFLYKEYLRIIAAHHPAVFVMENVKGLLSAKLNGTKIFDNILKDLSNPSSIFPKLNSPRYRIFSLASKPNEIDDFKNPHYKNNKDFLIQSEYYGIPQKRHRIILLGIREDIEVLPEILYKTNKLITLKEVINDLPIIRSGVNRTFVSSKVINGTKKRFYKTENDSDLYWLEIVNSFRKEIISWNGFVKGKFNINISLPENNIGSEFLKFQSPLKENSLFNWYFDKNLQGICNHESRSHLVQDLKRYMFASMFAKAFGSFSRLDEFEKYSNKLLPDHKNVKTGKFADRFRVQLPDKPATTITSHISKDGHYFIHYDPDQCRSLTVREAARIQTFPDNYLFCGSRTAQFHQVGNAVPPLLAYQIAEIVYRILIK